MRTNSARDIVVAAIAMAVLLAIPTVVYSPAFLDFTIRVASIVLFATSLNLLVGGTGLVSFGHGLFYGFGAYCFALLMQRTGLALPVAAALTLVASALVGLCVGAICIRLRQIYFAFATLAMQMLVYSIIIAWSALTGGDQGLQGGIPRRAPFGFDLAHHANLYTASVVTAVLGLLLMRHIAASPLGTSLRMIRDDEARAAFLGIEVWRAKLTVFVLAGVFAAMGGILAALFVSGAYPEQANWPISGDAIFAVMLGGISSFLGPLVGTVILLALNDVVSRFTEYHGLALGCVILIVTLGFRKGVLDVITARVGRNRRPVPVLEPAE